MEEVTPRRKSRGAIGTVGPMVLRVAGKDEPGGVGKIEKKQGEPKGEKRQQTNPFVGKTVMVVDDEKNLLNLLVMRFSNEGAQVIKASNGEEALRLLEQERVLPHCIVMDVMMPGPSGFEVCRKIKEDPGTRHIPLVLLSGVATRDGQKEHGEKMGASAYLTKPFKWEELREATGRLLGGQGASSA
jgi:CheY-like chemotaxis protein